jgi:lipoprotein-anchoring transpeptidase ErfK/SrfK
MRVARAVESVHHLLTRNRLLAIALVLAALAAAVMAAAYAYAGSQQDVIAKGVHVGSLDLGGLSADAARAKLERAFSPLRHPIVLRSGRRRLLLTPRQAQVSIDVDALVGRALTLSRRSWFLPRAWRELRGGEVKTTLKPQVEYSPVAVERIVRELQRRIDRSAVNAAVVPGFDRLAVRRGHPGIAVAVGVLRAEIERALVHRRARRLIEVPILHPRPKVTVPTLRRKYPSFVTIDRGAFTLRLYSQLQLVRSFRIAVGRIGLQTPAGLYHIQNKVVDPSWDVPLSSWTGSLAGKVIPPGPDDPLKARWLGIFNGAGIHGTDEAWSIGHAVSHGCVRMTIPDVIDLYDHVSIGTPVYIGD